MAYTSDGADIGKTSNKKVVKRKTGKKKNKHNQPSSVPAPPTGSVTFTPSVGASLTVQLNATTPVITDGYGQWEVVDRPRRLGLTRFKGVNPFKQDIAVLFDGWMEGVPQETDISSLMKMARQPQALQEPPKISLAGQAHRKDLLWVIENIDWDTDNVIWEISGSTPVRLRQAAVVHMLEFVEDSIIITQASPAVMAKTGGKRRKIIGVGMTLQQISQQEYGTPSGWHEILMANPWLQLTNKRDLIKPGQMVQIPYWKGHSPHTITVGQNG